jgi:hypothetical protein
VSAAPPRTADAPAHRDRHAARTTGERQDRGRRILTVVLVLAVLAAVVTVTLRGLYRDGPYEPSAPTPQGSKAVAQVLKDGGTDVATVRSTEQAGNALAGGRTVLVTDPQTLSAEQLDRLARSLEQGEGHLVLVRPDLGALQTLAPHLRPAGQVEDPVTYRADAACGPASLQARTVTVGPSDVDDEDQEQQQTTGTDTGPSGPATLYASGDHGQTCFGPVQGNPRAGAVAVEDRVTVLGSATFLTNQDVDDRDNAAVALNSLTTPAGTTWYVPSATDPLASSTPSLTDHLPRWLAPALLWAVLVVLVLLVAGARRLGPVVVEPLPVRVRARELTVGRAGLLERTHQRDRAAADLRAGSAGRLAARLGVRREAHLAVLVDALEGHTRLDAHALHTLLGPTPITTDQELVRLAHDLDRLEKEIDR